ncbi:MAG: hypothetical protein OEU46_19400 [Alphaproteobacteria bacterium]|nr:hypothetical protein [Alphaproteobacteria bacterium]
MRSGTPYRELFPTFTDRANLPIYYLITVLVGYAVLSRFLYGPYVPHFGGFRFVPAYLMVGAIALSGITISYARATRSFRILVRAIISFALFYVVTSRFTVSDALVAGKPFADFELNQAWLIAAICGVLGYFRPSFAIVTLQYIVWQKRQLMDVFGLAVDWLDYFTLIETGTVLIVGYLIYVGVRTRIDIDPATDRAATDSAGGAAKSLVLHPVDMLVIAAVALHFGNYFFAGVIKAYIGSDLTFWFRENPTPFLTLAALESKVLPLSFSEGLTAFAYQTMDKIFPVTNFATIVIQLFALFAVIRVRWAIYTTLAYDVLHLTIFVLTGIFFWKFIVLNLAIVAALATIRTKKMSVALQSFLCFVVVISPFVFHIFPSYAWLDSRSMNVVRLYAVTEDEKEVQVPSNYFLGLSVTFTQHRLVWPEKGPVTTESWGVAKSMEEMRQSLSCEWGHEKGDLPTATFYYPKEHISRLIRRYHGQALTMLDADGRFEYDIYPHHIFSMPWFFEDFRMLDKRRIKAYRYESETLCLDFKDGKPQHRRLWHATFDIPLL